MSAVAMSFLDDSNFCPPTRPAILDSFHADCRFLSSGCHNIKKLVKPRGNIHVHPKGTPKFYVYYIPTSMIPAFIMKKI